MYRNIRQLAAVFLLGVGIIALVVLPARAMAPLQCQDFVNYAMDISKKYIARACPRTPLMHLNREASYKWCLTKSDAQVIADKRAKNAAWEKCQAAKVTSGDAGFCGSYASELVQIWEEGAARGCAHFVSRMGRNSYNGHFNWCMDRPRAVAEKAIRDNTKHANSCK